MGECSEIAGGGGGGGGDQLVRSRICRDVKKRHHEVRRASERITNYKNCMKLLS